MDKADLTFWIRLGALSLALCASSGCGDSGLLEPPITGSFELVAINEHDLPVTVFVKMGYGWEDVVSGHAILNTDSSFRIELDRILYYTGVSYPTTITEYHKQTEWVGSFSRAASVVHFHVRDFYGAEAGLRGEFRDGTLSVAVEERTYRFIIR